MTKELSRGESILQAKCPHCRQGEMFPHSVYSFNHDKIHKNCSVCGLQYEIELGFFWGAMYISYGFSVAIIATVIVVSNVIFKVENPWIYIATIFAILAPMYPLSFRYSRVLMLHFFGSIEYNPKITDDTV